MSCNADDVRRQHEERTLDRRRVAVRVNSVSTKFFEEDMAYVVSTTLPTYSPCRPTKRPGDEPFAFYSNAHLPS